MVIGNVKILIIGLINTFITPRTTAKIIAPKSVVDTPGTKYAAIKIDNVDIIQCPIYIPNIITKYRYYTYTHLLHML